ncbi:DUF6578 domain-containing protein [Tsukamurella paurometabola]|uniref:DUF6578 domain-containing protein n=1 Tax=Tsukamurella paurometabola TaxID=2061 RepID=UPI000F7E1F48|nr:DUF6578 domain-containing protein [Tsukamurella paurometabola]UEA81662.1 hypothetical protein LK411_14815 [Tsukamurella paurometabola]
MNTPSAIADSLLYVHIDNWEYQCCGTTPRLGVELSGTLTVYESASPRYGAPQVTGFDPRSGLVRFGAISAQLGSGLSEPVGGLILVLSWHENEAKPRVTGTVEAVFEETGRFLPVGDDRSLRVDPDSREFHSVDEATRWPEEQIEGGGAATIGVVVGLRVTELRVPTADEIEARLLWEDRVRRTVRAIVPAALFAGRAPVVGDRLQLDLADPAVRALGDHIDSSATVDGEIAEVTPLPEIPEGAGWFALTPLTVEETVNYLVELVQDPENPVLR